MPFEGSRRRLVARATMVGAVVAAGLLAGCGGGTHRTLDATGVSRSIAQSILKQHRIYATVSCPTSVPQEKGHDFTCQAAVDVGHYPVPVTQDDNKGNVSWNTRAPLALVDMPRVRSAIRHSILSQRHVRASVVCPTQVLQQKGLKFTCTATVGAADSSKRVHAGDYGFTVVQTDDAGHVTYAAIPG